MGALQRVLLKSMVADMKLKIKTVVVSMVVMVLVMVMVMVTTRMMMASWSRRLTQRRGGEQ